MYICVCNAIRDTELRAAALRCPGGAEAVYESLGKAPQCGQCLAEAQVIVAEARLEQFLPACATA